MTCIGMSSHMRTALLAFVALAAVACGGNTSGGKVSYEGDNLVVDGVSYLRRPDAEICPPGMDKTRGNYEKGVIYLYWHMAPLEEWNPRVPVRERLKELGLASREEGGAVLVPVGWEDQWARALKAQPEIQAGQVSCAVGANLA